MTKKVPAMPKKKCEIITIHKDLFEALVYVKFCSHIIVKPRQEGWRTPDTDALYEYALIELARLDMLKSSLKDFDQCNEEIKKVPYVTQNKRETFSINKDLFEALAYITFCAQKVAETRQKGWSAPDADIQSKYALIENDKLDILKKSLDDFEDVLKFCSFTIR